MQEHALSYSHVHVPLCSDCALQFNYHSKPVKHSTMLTTKKRQKTMLNILNETKTSTPRFETKSENYFSHIKFHKLFD